MAQYHNLQPNLENRPATDRGAPTCHRRCHMSAEWVMEDAGFADGAGDEHDQMMQECAACWGCALPSHTLTSTAAPLTLTLTMPPLHEADPNPSLT